MVDGTALLLIEETAKGVCGLLAASLRPRDELRHVYPPDGSLGFVDEALGHPEPLGQLLLRKPCIVPHLAEKCFELLVLRALL